MEQGIASAVIGCGRMGVFTSESVKKYAPGCWFPLSHADAIHSHGELTLAALCDNSPEALKRAQAAYPSAQLYEDPIAMMREQRPVLLGIATRTIGRADIIARCASEGARAFHIEKPLCNNMTELARMTELFGRHDLFATYGAIRRHFAVYRDARELVRSGRFGRLLEVRVNMGRGMLFWTHPHSVDLLLFAADGKRPVGVQAKLDHVTPGSHAHEIASDPYIDLAAIHFEDGIVGQIGRAPGADLIWSCSDGEVAVENDGRAIRITARTGDNPYLQDIPHQVPATPPEGEGTAACMRELVRCLRGDTAAQVTNTTLKRDILLSQRLLFAMVQSHLGNSRVVAPEDVREDLTVLARTGSNFA